jgi:hypothetical protein
MCNSITITLGIRQQIFSLFFTFFCLTGFLPKTHYTRRTAQIESGMWVAVLAADAGFGRFCARLASGFELARASWIRLWERASASSTQSAMSYLKRRKAAISRRASATSLGRAYSLRLFIWWV